MTPYGKKAPPPAAQIGGGATPYLIKRGYIEVMVDVRGSGVSGGSFEMFGERQTQDGIELVDWASKLPNANGRVGMFGTSYLAINQLFTAAAVGPNSPLKAIFPVMSARDFYRDAAAMGGAPHLRTVRAYGAVYRLLNVVNPALEVINPGKHPRPRAGGFAGVRQRGRDQRGYFRPLIADAVAGGETAFDGPFWDAMRPAHGAAEGRRQRCGGLSGRRLARRLPARRAAELCRAAERLRRAARRAADATRPAGV